MKRRFPILLIAFCFIALSFNGEKKSKTYWYKAADNNGYISLEKTFDEKGNSILKTIVKASFDEEKLDFSLTTTCDSDKMLNASRLDFDGTIDSNMNTVNFTGKRVKTTKNGAFWHFTGDYKNQMSPDPEVKPFIESKHESSIRVPAVTIPSFNILAIVPNLKFDRKGTFKFNSLDETKLYVKKKHTINYLGKSKETVNGEVKELHKFVHQGKKMKPAYYWVNDNKELVKILLDGKFVFTLSNKEAVLQTNIADGNE
jgi:hypothetical protein